MFILHEACQAGSRRSKPGLLWNFPETVCRSPVTLAARSHVTRGALQAAAPTGTKGPLPLHLAGLLATAGSVASQKAIPGAGISMPCSVGALRLLLPAGPQGQLYSLRWAGGKASQLHTPWPAASGGRPGLPRPPLSCLSWSSGSLRPMITGLLEAPIRPLFWDDQTVQRGGEETSKNKHSLKSQTIFL